IVALAGIAGLATGFFRPAVYAGLPNLVAESDLARANSLIQTSENVSWTISPVIGGALVAASGPDLAYWVNAASFVISALLIVKIPQQSLQGALAVSRGHLRDLRDGFARVVRSRPLLTVLVVWTIALGAVASTQTAQIFLAKDAFSAGDFGYGLMFGCIGLGLAIGSFGAGSWVEHRSVGAVYSAGILLQAIGIGAAAIPPNVWASLPCFALAGIGNGTAVVCNSLLVQRGAEDAIRGRVFTVIMSVNYAVYALGVTGPPGVGKSTLISALVRHIRLQDRTVGVISVDPSSPFTQGALLGDRIRLADHFLDPGVFIRSMGTRGHLGGLAEATLQALLVLDAAGKDLVFLETVGAGQGGVEGIGIAASVVLVLMPGSGDSVQALKAGIMEIPDVIAINKMDHPAAKTMLNEVRSILSLDKEGSWKPPIVLTEATTGQNVPELWEKIEAHRAYLESEGDLEERRRKNLANEVFAIASGRAKAHLEQAVSSRPPPAITVRPSLGRHASSVSVRASSCRTPRRWQRSKRARTTEPRRS